MCDKFAFRGVQDQAKTFSFFNNILNVICHDIFHPPTTSPVIIIIIIIIVVVVVVVVDGDDYIVVVVIISAQRLENGHPAELLCFLCLVL